MAGWGQRRRQGRLPPMLTLLTLLAAAAVQMSDAFVTPFPIPSRFVVPAPASAVQSSSIGSRTARSLRLRHYAGGRPVANVALIKDPEDMYESAVARGVKKANMSAFRMLVLAVQAGMQVGIGAAMALVTLAGLTGLSAANPSLAKLVYGVVGLPCGLLMTATTGTQLFTGNTAVCSMAFMERKITAWQLLRNWTICFTGNMLGATLLAGLCTYAGVFESAAPAIRTIAAYKGALPFGVAFARGILCNWLVCHTVYIAQGCKDFVSKAVATLMIITIFAALGFEHSVANLWLGPFAAMNGGMPWGQFMLKNLLPVTLGNVFAGFVIVAGTYFASYGSFSKRFETKRKQQ